MCSRGGNSTRIREEEENGLCARMSCFLYLCHMDGEDRRETTNR
jgi:hypothetical protein